MSSSPLPNLFFGSINLVSRMRIGSHNRHRGLEGCYFRWLRPGRGLHGEHLLGQGLVILRAYGRRFVLRDRESVTCGLSQAHIVPDQGPKDIALKMPSYLLQHFLREPHPDVHHRGQSTDLNPVTGMSGQHLDNLHELGQSMKREEPHLDRNDGKFTGTEGVKGKDAQAGWRIDNDIVIGPL